MLVPRDRKRGPILTLGTSPQRRSFILTGRVEKGTWPEDPGPQPQPFPEEPMPDEPNPEPALDPDDDDSEEPDGPDGGPDPLPGPEYPSEPTSLPLDLLLRSSHGVLGGLVGQAITGIAQTINALQNIQAAYAPFITPAPVPAQMFQPLRSSLSQPEPLPLQSLPQIPPSPISQSIRETPAYQILSRIREAQYQRMERLAERNTPDGRSASRSVAETGMPGPARNFNGSDSTGQTRASTTNIVSNEPFQPPSPGLAPQEAFRQLLNPSAGLSLPVLQPFLQEDPRWIQENLSHAARPLSQQEQLQMAQVRQQADVQQQIQQAQLAAAQAQREMYQAQTRMLRERQQQVRGQAASQPPQASASVHGQPDLKARQQLLNDLFGSRIFDGADMQYPYTYTLKNGQKVNDPNIARMTAVANWILFGLKSAQWDNAQVIRLREALRAGRESALTPGRIRQLDIAARLHTILKHNEELPSFQRDDAKAFALGMRVLIDANTHKGKVDERQLIEDMKFFMIDQHPNLIGIPAGLLHGFKESNAAYNLMGGPRLGTVGWNEKYWDHGQQFDANGNPINQAHHFAAFLITGLGNTQLSGLEAGILDGIHIGTLYNPQDVALAELAISMAQEIKTEKMHWSELPENLYRQLKN